MDIDQIRTALEHRFGEPGARVVFWDDPGGEFENDLPAAIPEEVELIRLDRESALDTKLRVERIQPDARFLLYSTAEEPSFDDDWLLDMRLYSGPAFRADRASIILHELGLRSLSLREHIASRRKFFESRERTLKLRALVAPDDDGAALDMKMLAVIVRADTPDPLTITRALLHGFAERGDGEGHLASPPQAWREIERLDLAGAFWTIAEAQFGYTEEIPSLRNLLIRLLVSDFSYRLGSPLPQSIEHLLLPIPSNAAVCLAGWRDSTRLNGSYDLLSNEVAETIGLEGYLSAFELEDMLEVMTFAAVERAIARCLRDQVEATANTIAPEAVRSIAARRQAGHWASPPTGGANDVTRAGLHSVYNALAAAADFFDLRNRHRWNYDMESAGALYRAYEQELYRIDQIYRLFCEAADHAEEAGMDLLKTLRERVEASYRNDYLKPLAHAWGKFIDPESGGGLLNTWTIENVPNQHEFFERHIAPRLDEGENRKVFVIVSDAFRYEAARELAEELNGRYRIQADVSSQLGVLPSYTALGMASLLPHATLAYKSDGAVLIDGRAASSLDARNELLKKLEGLACKSDALMAMRKEDGRALTNGKRVVYIYHDTIDAIGDKASTEEKTFMAVRKAIGELAALVSYVVNNLNGNHIIVTADHGFLFTEAAPGETDKSKLLYVPEGAIKPKKRYVIGRDLGNDDQVWHGFTGVTAGTDDSAGVAMEFWIPKGINLFHFVGGARFVHGGAMPQEIVVPVVTVRQVKDKETMTRTKPKQVRVQVLGTNHRITTARHRFELIQTDPVSERVRPVTLKIAVYDGDQPVTDVATITLDSQSSNMEERRRSILLTLREGEYDKRRTYRLSLRDADTGVEQQYVDVIIDRAFTDDF